MIEMGLVVALVPLWAVGCTATSPEAAKAEVVATLSATFIVSSFLNELCKCVNSLLTRASLNVLCLEYGLYMDM